MLTLGAQAVPSIWHFVVVAAIMQGDIVFGEQVGLDVARVFCDIYSPFQVNCIIACIS